MLVNRLLSPFHLGLCSAALRAVGSHLLDPFFVHREAALIEDRGGFALQFLRGKIALCRDQLVSAVDHRLDHAAAGRFHPEPFGAFLITHLKVKRAMRSFDSDKRKTKTVPGGELSALDADGRLERERH